MHIRLDPSSKVENSDTPKAVILAIDDDPATVADIVRILGAGGYTCHCCRDLDGAAEQFGVVSPDLVIADLSIAGPNGCQLKEAIRREAGYLDVPLMYLSNAQGPDIIHRHGECGGVYYVRKPLNVLVLLELVDKALWKPQLSAVL
ncbi:MAG: response regulator [Pirellulales bacterium]